MYDIAIVDGSMVGEIASRSVGKDSNIVRLLPYNSHIFYDSNNNALFKAYSCPLCDDLIKRAYILEQHLTTYKERVKHVFPKIVNQIRETLFDKLNSFNILYSDDQKLFKNMAKFHFELRCVQEDKFRDTDTATWIGKHFPISVSIFANLIEQPIFCAFPIPEL